MLPRLLAGLSSTVAASGILGAAHITTGIGVVITSCVGAAATIVAARFTRGSRDRRDLRTEMTALERRNRQLERRNEHLELQIERQLAKTREVGP